MNEELLSFIPGYLLALFRIAALFLSTPLFGNARVPRRFKAAFALAMTAGLVSSCNIRANLPPSIHGVAIAIASEMLMGLAMGLAISLMFIAVHWAGHLIGQQMGIGLAEVFDPSMGGEGSVVSEMYYMLAMIIFLTMGGHHSLVRAVAASFATLPLGSLITSDSIVAILTGLLTTASALAMQLAAPVIATVIVADVAMGLISRTMPQLNIMSAGLALRSGVGLLVVILGLSLTSQTIGEGMTNALDNVWKLWEAPPK